MTVGAVILTGGKSRRMGTEKYKIKIGDQTFLERMAANFDGFPELFVSVDAASRHPDIDLPMVADRWKDCGPISGICSSLLACQSDALVVVSCDIPFFNSRLLDRMLEELEEDESIDLVMPKEANGFLQPVCGVYRKRCADTLLKYIESGNYCLLDPLQVLNIRTIPAEEFRQELININTPEDYEREFHVPVPDAVVGDGMPIKMKEARARIRTHVPSLTPEVRSLDDAAGCTLSETVTASIAQPPFPRSPYDGYALCAADSEGASPNTPVTLSVVGHSYAGVPFDGELHRGEAVRIMTGGKIPDGADCVIPQEKTDEGEEQVKLFAALSAGDNYCPIGEDYPAGCELIPAGTKMDAAAMAVASGAGLTEVSVIPKPRIAVFSTGDELVSPGEPLSPGKIYNSNETYLLQRLSELGLPVSQCGILGDSDEELAARLLEACKDSDAVFTTGGVSVGQKDRLPHVLEQLDAEFLFKGVSMKPGSPVTFALVNGVPVMAMSGNPFAAVATFETLGRDLLAALSGQEELLPERRATVLKTGFSKRRGCTRYAKATWAPDGVTLMKKQKNGQLQSMIGTNCLAVLPAGDEPLEPGTGIDVLMI